MSREDLLTWLLLGLLAAGLAALGVYLGGLTA